MRIIIYAPWFLYYSIQLANALCKNHKVLLLTRNNTGEVCYGDSSLFIAENLDQRVKWEFTDFRKRSILAFWDVLKLARKIRSFAPDMFYFHDTGDFRVYFTTFLLQATKKVLTIHDIATHPGDQTLPRQEFIRRMIRKRADCIICHGETLKRQLITQMKELDAKVNVVKHGELSLYRKWMRADVREESHTILFFGRISKYKGLDYLIKASELAYARIPNLKVIVAGRGPDLERCREMIRSHNLFEIHNEYIPNEKVAELFQRSRVIVLPYIEASQSGVIAIAYSFGKPVIATKVGAIPEVVEHGKTGLLVEPKNADILADAIVRLLDSEEMLRSCKANIEAFVSSHLSWDAIAEETVNICQN